MSSAGVSGEGELRGRISEEKERLILEKSSSKKTKMSTTSELELQIAEKQLEIIQKQNEVRMLEQQLRILELKAGKRTSISIEESQPKEIIQVAAPVADNKSQSVEDNHSFDEDERKMPFYVIIKGPGMGIHTDYAKVKNLPSTHYRKEDSREAAEQLFDLIRQKKTFVKNQLQKFSPSNLLSIQSRLIQKTCTKEEWINLYRVVIRAAQEDKIVPVNRQGHIKGIALEGINCELFFDLFQAGLIDTVYPSVKLDEFSGLPQVMKTLKVYIDRCKIKESRKTIFCKVVSTVPDWEDGKDFLAYHLIKIGVSGDFVFPAVAKAETDTVTESEICLKRLDGFYNIISELDRISPDSKIKLNYLCDNIAVISKFTKPIARGEFEKLKKWQKAMEEEPKVSRETRESLKEVIVVTKKESSSEKEE